MHGFNIVNLSDLLEEIGEERTKDILSSFLCPLNSDVEYFLCDKAVEFSKQSIAQTHLLFASHKKNDVLVGYYTLTNKTLVIPSKEVSNSLRKRLLKFSVYDSHLKQYTMSCPLIAQLGKNYANNYNELITGDELLHIACDSIRDIQMVLGGQFTYVECDDNINLIDFYTRNGFIRINNRTLNKCEKRVYDPVYLVQLIKRLK